MKNLIIFIAFLVIYYLTNNLFIVIFLFFFLSYISPHFSKFVKKSNDFKQDKEKSLKLKKVAISKFILGLGLFSQTDEFDNWKISHQDDLNRISDDLGMSLDQLIKYSSFNDENFISKMDDENFINSAYSSIDMFITEMDMFNSFTLNMSINPATGLPMIGDSGIDVGGNPMGVDLGHQFENPFDNSSYDNPFDHNSHDDFKF